MTITLEWWQIGVLIPLILIAIVISSRLVTLIGMVAIQHWSKQTPNPIFASEQSLRLSALNESRRDSKQTYWDRGVQNVLRYGDTNEAVQLGRVARDAEAGRAPTREEWRELLGNSRVEYLEPEDIRYSAFGSPSVESSGSTGSSPIGTSYDTEGAKFVPEKPIKPKRNKGTWLRPRLFKGKHPHV